MSTPDPEGTLRVESATPLPRSSRSDPQFAPGTIIADRYRIAGILGAGGMGEVYRADDTKLDQAVALKFLPATLARDPVLLARLHDEVRLGRQIAHPNVCRTYDIVDASGAHFVAMEYVDGEDLARLLRRIGRLSPDKAVDITRGIAAGLMAAHAKGILHRDLKPANVMVDSRGEARIMDFGLALAAGEDDGTISGTPAYMAPEQLEGQPATVQSDLYALGLVMYELFTGKQAHGAQTMRERVRELSSEIVTPSNVIRDIDPAVERIILRCLSNDPSQRPASAREVIGALPGGDPLAAALAAGETPSPRIVAAAGTEGSLKPAQAWGLLAAIVLLLVVSLEGKRRLSFTAYEPLAKSAEVTAERTATTLRALGIPAQPYAMYTYRIHDTYLAWLFGRDRAEQRERLRRGVRTVRMMHVEGVKPQPPGLQTEVVMRPGTTVTEVEADGRLVSLDAIPLGEWKARPVDWGPLLAAARLDPRTLSPASPHLTPRAPTDVRTAWTGPHPDGGMPIVIEAAAWRGTPVFFRITGPWESASTEVIAFANTGVQVFMTVMVLSVLAVGLLLAWRNLRLRRGDRQGALRAATCVFLLEVVGRLLVENHAPSGLYEVSLLRRAISDALLWGASIYVLYLALEPFVRRRWPENLISSARLLSGNHRDPMVGRDVLIGILAGMFHIAVIMIQQWIVSQEPTFFGNVGLLAGARYGLGYLITSFADGALQGFILLVILVTFMLLLRHRGLAAAGLVVVMMTGYYMAVGRFVPSMFLIALMVAGVTARFGLLAAIVTQATFLCLFPYPLFTSLSWTSLQALPVLVIVALTLWAFRTSLGGQAAFGRVLDE
jgi:hypothetical protein